MRKPAEGWQAMVDHINAAWKVAKRSDLPYPFTGRDLRQLRQFVEIYQTWGLMALWNCYLAHANDFIKSRGYTIEIFVGSLPWLVDKQWKAQAETYRKEIERPLPKEVQDLLFDIAPLPPPKPKKSWRPRSPNL